MEQDIPTTPTSPEPSSKRKKYLFAGIAAVIILASIPITYILTQQQQDLRQRASETQVCGDSPADILLAIDKSPSMLWDSKLRSAKTAAKSFVDTASQNTDNQLALISYSNPNDTKTEQTLSNNFSSISNKVDQISYSSGTCISCAVQEINNEVSQRSRSNLKNVAILLTDGRANQVLNSDPRRATDSNIAEEEALKLVKEGFEESNTVYFTIGLGEDVNENFLKQIASETGGKYYFSPSGNELEQIYQEISEITGKGIISGFVYEDQNKNGAHEDHEPKLEGWEVKLTQNNSRTETQTTDDNGGYSFKGLCNEAFEVSLTTENDWTTTNPTTGTHQITISQGQAENETNFGVIEQKDPAVARIQAQMPGIGQNVGDNATPSAETRIAEITIFNTQNEPIKEGTGSATFDGTDTYVGTINLGTEFASGIYYAQVRFDNTLRSRIDGVHQINEGETTDFPSTTLTSGDLDQNNILDLRDYNIFLSCFNNEGCDEISERKSDLNDNGNIEPVDYNILLRSFAIREGA